MSANLVNRNSSNKTKSKQTNFQKKQKQSSLQGLLLFFLFLSIFVLVGSVSVIVLFNIVSSCVIDCKCNFSYCKAAPVTDLFVKCHLKFHIDTNI